MCGVKKMEYGLRKKIVVVYLLQPKGFRYEGLVLDDNEDVLVITDKRSNRDVFINKANISSIEVIQE